MKTIRFILFTCVMLASSYSWSQTPCAVKTSNPEMTQQYYSTLKSGLASEKIRIVVFPFQDGSLSEPDDVLEKGFSYIFYNLLNQSHLVGVYNPYLVWEQLSLNNMTSADYFSDSKVYSIAQHMEATYAVYGMFQRQSGGIIRYFVKMMAIDPSQSKPTAPVTYEFTTEESDRFFSIAADASISLLDTILNKKLDKLMFKNFLTRSPSFEAFRFFIKGMNESKFYQEINLGVSKVWFEKATNLSYTFLEAYDEMARSLLMEALLQKQSLLDNSISWSDALQVLHTEDLVHQSLFLTKGADGKKQDFKKEKKIPQELDSDRWINGNNYFIIGLNLFKAGNYNDAAMAFNQAISWVPEDGIAHSYLSKTYSALKDSTKAKNEQDLALKLGSCLK